MLPDCVVLETSRTGESRHFSLRRYEAITNRKLRQLPRIRRLLIENLGRAMVSGRIAECEDLLTDLATGGKGPFPFFPSRLLMQDASGIPLLQDFIALQEARERPRECPQLPIPTALVVDHGIEVLAWGAAGAAAENLVAEIEQNTERYRFLKWCAMHFVNLRVIEPGSGIVHSVNLEHFCVPLVEVNGWIAPDSVIGSDSHTTMSNGAGILSWGAGGLDMLSLMAGNPAQVMVPPIVRLELLGELQHPAGAADAAYALAEFLRTEVASGSALECDGPGVRTLSVFDRTTIANMAPEYGTWLCLFPLDDAIRPVLSKRGLYGSTIDRMLAHVRADMLAHVACDDDPRPELRFDLSALSPMVAGPGVPWKRKIQLPTAAVTTPSATRDAIGEGGVVLAAIASCTTTSNPKLLIEAALLAKAAVACGLTVAPYIKTSFSPGSPALADFLRHAGLLDSLERLGFAIAGYGCASCVGNSGPLHPDVAEAIERGQRGVVAVLSGNRNFPHRIQHQLSENYLASPALVVAYALAGTINVNFDREPVGQTGNKVEVHLREILPSAADVSLYEARYLNSEPPREAPNQKWHALSADFADESSLWQALAPKFSRPPFGNLTYRRNVLADIENARCLAAFGDEITTDHISPIGAIPGDSAAALYLREAGIAQERLGSFVGWRGNSEVMRLGTFSHRALENLLLPGMKGPYSIHAPSGALMEIPHVASLYDATATPLVILAGQRYGAGSARDWAAKGTRLLGVRAVAACSFERIHRANLVAAGVVPLLLPSSAHPCFLALDPQMTMTLRGLGHAKQPDAELTFDLRVGGRTSASITAHLALENAHELELLRHGGMMGFLARQIEEADHASR